MEHARYLNMCDQFSLTKQLIFFHTIYSKVYTDRRKAEQY